MEEVLQRPWSAEVATPVDGAKPKYNLKEANSEGWMATVMATQKAAPAKSPSTKKLKEQWAKELVSTVDYVRENDPAQFEGEEEGAAREAQPVA